VSIAPAHEIVKINWRAIAISEWQSFDFAQGFNHDHR